MSENGEGYSPIGAEIGNLTKTEDANTPDGYGSRERSYLESDAYKSLLSKNQSIFSRPEVTYQLINTSEKLGHQLTAKDIDNMQEQINEWVIDDTNQREKIADLVRTNTKSVQDRVTAIEVLHMPHDNTRQMTSARIRVRATTEKGYKVTVRSLSALGGSKILSKIEATKAYYDELIGQEIQFGTALINSSHYLRLNPNKLSEHFRVRDYGQISEWYKQQHQDKKNAHKK